MVLSDDLHILQRVQRKILFGMETEKSQAYDFLPTETEVICLCNQLLEIRFWSMTTGAEVVLVSNLNYIFLKYSKKLALLPANAIQIFQK